MNYEEAVAYIDETPKFTKKNSLDHTKECLRRLGNPQDKFKVIHVAGTNGKGSTCAFLTSVLREAGYSCGLFTSPHLVEINERFQINEVNIDNDTFLKAFEKVKVLADELVAEGSYHPTYFEMLFLMGMVIFADAGVDYVTLETGLGGRMDATTAVENPVACVITSISLDHMQYLGDTVAKIAGEKAGIIVPGVPVIYDGNDPDAAEVIRARAEELGSPAYEVKRSDTEVLRNTSAGIDFAFRNEYYKDMVFSIPFIAKYQYGINETISSIEDFLDLKVNYYAKTNFSGITNIIDALGGVTIDSPYEFTTLHGHYHINKGINQMDGDKALCFVRERYALPSGDFDRGRNQQRLLKAMINKAVSPKIITNYSNILQAVEGCFETNMSSEDIKSLVQTQLDDMSKWKMYNVQLTGDPEISYKTYSMKGKKCYTMKPNKKSLNGIINVINKIEDGKRITDQDVKGLQGA